MIEPIANPAFGEVVPGAITVSLEPFADLPASAARFSANSLNFTYHAGDGSGRMFAGESFGGRIWEIGSDGAVDPTPFLDMKAVFGADLLDGSKAAGLRSFAFHPDFEVPGAAGEGRLYTIAVMTPESAPADVTVFDDYLTPVARTVITEWRLDATGSGRIDPASAREVLRIAEPHLDHNGEQLMFDPNARPGDADYGMLYVSVGDGAADAIGDPFQLAQRLDSAHGKILRLDPLAQANGDAFAAPADNPFIGVQDALTILWAVGGRHIENLVFDPAGAGRMIFTDIGAKQVEEVNIGLAGAITAGSSGKARSPPPPTAHPTRQTATPTPCPPTTPSTASPIPWRNTGALSGSR